MNEILQLALATFLSAAAGSGLIVLLDWNAKRLGRRKEGKEQMLGAIQAHLQALESYDRRFQQQALAGVTNQASNNGQFAPLKPSSREVVVAFRKASLLFPSHSQLAIRDAEYLVNKASKCDTRRDTLANWESEADEYNKLVICIAAWNDKSKKLPTIRPNNRTTVTHGMPDGDDYPKLPEQVTLDFHVLPSSNGKTNSYFGLSNR